MKDKDNLIHLKIISKAIVQIKQSKIEYNKILLFKQNKNKV